ncbi:hypothetical protein ES705_50575 [subsurface metagenome]
MKGDAYIDNTSFNQWFAGILTNKSIVGIRTEDIVRLIHFIKTDIREVEAISALTYGTTGSELLHAAVFNGTIQKVCLVQPFLSFVDIALTHEYSPAFIPSTVAGAIEEYDLADLMAALCPRKVLIINPLTSDRSPAVESKVSGLLAYPIDVYAHKGVEENFMHCIEKENLSVYEQINKWLK